MLKTLLSIPLLFLLVFKVYSQPGIVVLPKKDGFLVKISDNNNNFIASPPEGLWSISTDWVDNWPANWYHTNPTDLSESGDWTILRSEMDLGSGKMLLRDAYREENGMIKCIRRFEWKGDETLKKATLSVRWQVPGKRLKAFLPGILYYGNPSGELNRPEWVPWYHGDPGEMAIFEEHRYPLPFACLESGNTNKKYGAALHTIPSPIKDKKLADHWWSMGVTAHEDFSELVLMSGPITYNGVKSVAKALQARQMEYGDTYIDIEPGTVIEKTYYIDVYAIEKQGTAFQKPIYSSLDIFKPYYPDDLPSFSEILEAKLRFSGSRWIDEKDYPGFSMYPPEHTPQIVMGWCGQAASCGYAFQNLKEYIVDPDVNRKIQSSLDFLSTSPVNGDGFPVRFNTEKKEWYAPDPVSMGQGMYNIAKAVQAAKKNGQFNTSKWEEFLKASSDYASNRILDEEWFPRSTAEGFYIAPLTIAHELFGTPEYRESALKAAGHYASRHLTMEEPYWGGTLDARGEDKEGAWAAFQGFLAVYEMTKNPEHLEWAKHAMDVCLSYSVVWDIPLPPGRMADHNFKTRGWTVVSPQNQHIDIYGVFYTPEIYKMGKYLNDERLKKLAIVMYRTCGQLIDPFGSQGEQLQHTNFAQHGDMSDIYKLRGGYSESWTVFWITAHFLNAAARFIELEIDMK